MDCRTAWMAGQKKKIAVIASCGASSRIGSAVPPKVTRFCAMRPPPPSFQDE